MTRSQRMSCEFAFLNIILLLTTFCRYFYIHFQTSVIEFNIFLVRTLIRSGEFTFNSFVGKFDSSFREFQV